jgi:hypothetical protein
VQPSLHRTGCWDIVDMGIATHDDVCSKCEAQIRCAPSISVSTSSDSKSLESSSTISHSWSVSSDGSRCLPTPPSSVRSNSPIFDAALDGSLRREVQKGKSPVSLAGLSSFKPIREDGSVDPSRLHWRAYHLTERSMWPAKAVGCAVADSMYAVPPEEGFLEGLKSSTE